MTLQVWVSAVAATTTGVAAEARYWIEQADLSIDDRRWVITHLHPPQAGPAAMLPIGTAPATPPELTARLDGFTLITPPISSHP